MPTLSCMNCPSPARVIVASSPFCFEHAQPISSKLRALVERPSRMDANHSSEWDDPWEMPPTVRPEPYEIALGQIDAKVRMVNRALMLSVIGFLIFLFAVPVLNSYPQPVLFVSVLTSLIATILIRRTWRRHRSW